MNAVKLAAMWLVTLPSLVLAVDLVWLHPATRLPVLLALAIGGVLIHRWLLPFRPKP